MTCSRCGRCCYLFDFKTKIQTNIPCPHLEKLSDGTTKCKIYYRNRIGRKIGLGNVCNYRDNVKLNYPGCSMNKEGQRFVEKVDV